MSTRVAGSLSALTMASCASGGAMPQDHSQQQLGKLAVERGLITAGQLREALQEFNVRRAAGSRLPLGEVFVELGFLARPQLELLLQAQGGKKRPREQIPGFELIRKLGEGGMGATYLARQTSLDRLVALKVLRPQLSKNSNFTGRFKREAQLAGRLDHVNIVQAIDVGEAGGFHYLVMEYVEGQDLIGLMPENGGMAEAEALQIMAQIGHALQYAHEHGIIHRDVKPDNVLVTKDRVAKLCDFGLARQAEGDSSLTQTGTAMGTPHYISPEQARGESGVDIRSDIYSLGATLYRLVTGETPFSGTTAAVVMTKHLTEQVPWPQDVNPDVSDGCSQIIAKAMTKPPAGRYQLPVEMVEDLELLANGKPLLHARAESLRSSVGTRGTVPVKRAAGRARDPYRATRLHDPVDEEPGRKILGLPLSALVCIGAGLVLLVALGIWALTREKPREMHDPKTVAEAAAREEWNSGVKTLIKEKLRPAEAETLRAALDGFKSRHSGTDFFASRTEERARLREGAEKAIAAAGEKNIEDMLVYAQEYWRNNPGNYREARAKFEVVLTAAKGTLHHMKAEDAIKEIDTAQEQAATAAFAALKAKSDGLAAKGDYDAAIALLGVRPGKLTDLLIPRMRSELKKLRAEARGKVEAAIAKAEKLSKDGEPGKGLAELEKVATLKYQPVEKTLTALRARLRKENRNVAELQRKRLEAGARKRLAAILEEVDALLLAGKTAQATQRLTALGSQVPEDERAVMAPALKSMGGLIAEVVRIRSARRKALDDLTGKQVTIRDSGGTAHTCKLRGIDGKKRLVMLTREFRIMGTTRTRDFDLGFDDLAAGELERLVRLPAPQKPAEHLATAFVATSTGNLAGAAAGIRAAKDHPLAPRYAKKLAQALKNLAEAVARQFWEKKVAPALKKEPSPEEAKALAAVLEGFLKVHGKTGFAQSRQAEIGKLMALSGKAVSRTPEVILARVKQLFKGRVIKYTPKTAEIEIFYDFSDPRQLEDWRLSSWGSGSTAPRIEGQRLRLPKLNKYLHIDARFETVTIRTDFDATVEKSGGYVTLLAAASGHGDWYALFPLINGQKAALAKCNEGRETLLTKVKPSPCAQTRRGSMSLQVERGRLTGYVGKMRFTAEDNSFAAGYAGLCSLRTDVHFDNVRVVGRLDRAWLKSRLEEPLPAFSARWQRLNTRGKAPPPRGQIWRSLTYDSKRKRAVLWGGHHQKWNDMWALDSTTSTWSCLQANAPKGPGVGKVRPPGLQHFGLTYDSGNDLYWINQSWAYSPAAGGWKRHAADLAGVRKRTHAPWVRAALAYDPDGKRFLFWNSRCAFVAPGTNRWRQVPDGPSPRSYADGGLVYDRKNKVFVFFGGAIYKGPVLDDTWIFDPRKSSWHRANPPTRPAARCYHKLLWHQGLEVIVMHGGEPRGPTLSDLWVFDTPSETWTPVHAAGMQKPGAGATAYDAARDAVVLLTHGSETWTLEMTRIREPAKPKPLPESRWAGTWHAMKGAKTVTHPHGAAFDTKRGAYLLAGADFAVWAYRLRTDNWIALSPPAPGDGKTFPKNIGNCPAGCAYDPVRDELIFAGGNNRGDAGSGGTVFFDMTAKKWQPGDTKSRIAPAFARGGDLLLRYSGEKLLSLDQTGRSWKKIECRLPPLRVYPQAGLIYDAPRKRFFMSAGGYGAYRSDTWTFDPRERRWNQVKTRRQPTRRCYSSLCHDPVNDVIVLHGGKGKKDTWIFDPSQKIWCRLPVKAPPEAELSWLAYDTFNKCSIAYDPSKGKIWVLKLSPRRR